MSEDTRRQSLDVEIKPHLETTLYYTLAFCAAWGWDLVIYAISHVKVGILYSSYIRYYVCTV